MTEIALIIVAVTVLAQFVLVAAELRSVRKQLLEVQAKLTLLTLRDRP